MKVLIFVQFLIGRILNFAGLPGFLRPCQYDASITQAHVSVRISPRFTVVSVSGLDIYFHRLTGVIDGIGFSPSVDCTKASTRKSIDFGAPPFGPPLSPQIEIQSQCSE